MLVIEKQTEHKETNKNIEMYVIQKKHNGKNQHWLCPWYIVN